MARQRLTIGAFGDIGFRTSPNGRVVARARYRGWDGKSRPVQVTGDTRKQAERVLKAKLAERSLLQPTFTTLTADSPLTDLVAYWLEDIELEDRLSQTTRNLYERNMRTLVLPVLGKLTLRELGVTRFDHFLKQLAKQSCNRCQTGQGRPPACLGLLAVRHEVLPCNPMDHVARLHREPHIPDALTPAAWSGIGRQRLVSVRQRRGNGAVLHGSPYQARRLVGRTVLRA